MLVAATLVIVTDNVKESVATTNAHEIFEGTIVIDDDGIKGDPTDPDPEKTGISYDSVTNVLTLDNAKIKAGLHETEDGDKLYLGIHTKDGLYSVTILLIGANEIIMPSEISQSNTAYGIYAENEYDLTVTGTDSTKDSLTIEYSVEKLSNDEDGTKLNGIRAYNANSLSIINCAVDIGYDIQDNTNIADCRLTSVNSSEGNLYVGDSAVEIHLDKFAIGDYSLNFRGLVISDGLLTCVRSEIKITTADLTDTGEEGDIVRGLDANDDDSSIIIVDCNITINIGKLKQNENGMVRGVQYDYELMVVNSNMEISISEAEDYYAIGDGNYLYRMNFRDVKSVKYIDESGVLQDLENSVDCEEVKGLHVVANGISPTPGGNDSSIDPIVIVIAFIVALPIIGVASLLFSHKP